MARKIIEIETASEMVDLPWPLTFEDEGQENLYFHDAEGQEYYFKGVPEAANTQHCAASVYAELLRNLRPDCVQDIRDILWPADDPDKPWGPETLDRIAELVGRNDTD